MSISCERVFLFGLYFVNHFWSRWGKHWTSNPRKLLNCLLPWKVCILGIWINDLNWFLRHFFPCDVHFGFFPLGCNSLSFGLLIRFGTHRHRHGLGQIPLWRLYVEVISSLSDCLELVRTKLRVLVDPCHKTGIIRVLLRDQIDVILLNNWRLRNLILELLL